mmetsp:Transcript_4351/g.9419  ORF Transcript_4351/g.9419 Transcript_4351/m.9419 type:complete len:237 (+) Transcript_4351:698-1408(+)
MMQTDARDPNITFRMLFFHTRTVVRHVSVMRKPKNQANRLGAAGFHTGFCFKKCTDITVPAMPSGQAAMPNKVASTKSAITKTITQGKRCDSDPHFSLRIDSSASSWLKAVISSVQATVAMSCSMPARALTTFSFSLCGTLRKKRPNLIAQERSSSTTSSTVSTLAGSAAGAVTTATVACLPSTAGLSVDGGVPASKSSGTCEGGVGGVPVDTTEVCASKAGLLSLMMSRCLGIRQ